MEQPTDNRRFGPLRRLLAAVVSAAFVIAPTPLLAQQGGGAQKGDESKSAEQTDKEAEEKADRQPNKPTPKLFLLPTVSVKGQITSIVPERIGEMLRERVGSEGRVKLLPTYIEIQKSKPGAGGQVSAAIAEAQKEYTSAIGLLEAGEYQKAADKFSGVVDTLRSNIGDVRNFDIYADALAKLARAYWEINHNYDARKSIREYAHLRPEAELDPKKYPEGLREIFEQSAAKVEKAGAGKLVIESNVDGAQVFVDGEKKGETKSDAALTLTDVKFGYHYVVVRDPRGGTWSQQLRVRGRGKEQSYQVELGTGGSNQEAAKEEQKGTELPAFYTELQAAIKDGNFGTDLQPYLEELTKRTGVDYVAWVVMVKGEEEYVAAPFVYRVEDGLFVQGENVKFNFELSNLMVGVSDLRKRIIATLLEMPQEKAITSVSLVDEEEEEKKTAAATQTKSSSETAASGDTSSTDTASSTSQETTQDSVEPPPKPPPSQDKKMSPWTYVGIGGAALLVGGLTAGGILLFGGNGQPKPNGFTAQVEW